MNKYKAISEFALLLNGYAFKSGQYADEGTRIIRIANVQEGYITDENSCFYPAASMQGLERYTLRENDLLISLTGNVGRVGILPKSMLPAALNQRVCCIRFKTLEVDTKYLFYYLSRKEFVKDCVNVSRGVAQLNLSTKWLEQYPVPVPDKKKQQYIVTRIEELFSKLDKGVETLQTIKQQLAVYRQAVRKKAFEGVLTKSPVEKFEFLGNLIEKPRYGTSKKCDYEFEEHSTPVYRIPNICYRLGTISKENIKFAKFTAAELHDLRLQSGDILIIRSNGSVSLVGRAAIVRESDIDGTFAGYLMRLRIKDSAKINPRYLLHYLNSHNARMYIENKAKSTSGVNNINSSEICGLTIPMVEYIEQLQIVDAIESRLSVCDSIEQTVDAALAQAEAMRQSILKKAFEGGL